MKQFSLISASLLAWYDRCARTMPWRGIHDPYRTWVSEAMLQQTRVDTVLPYYERFLQRFPALPDLAASDEADVLKQWEGLGYYSRARNLLKGARQVMEQFGGQLPSEPALLRKISGIGPYTAGAIASIAYDVRVPAVDGNVLRVFSRLCGIRENIGLPEVRKKLESLAAAAVPEKRPGDYNQAVMDLGATVCVPGTPDCTRCPLSSFCDAFAHGDAESLPIMPVSRPPKAVRWSVPVIISGGRTLVRCRTESLLRGMWSFPLLDCDPGSVFRFLEKKYRIRALAAGDPVHARHVFTHLVWEMDVIPAIAEPGLPDPADFRWVTLETLSGLAFPAAMNVPLQAARHILQA